MCANIFTEEMAERKCHEQSFVCVLCQPDQSTLSFVRHSSTNCANDQQVMPTKSIKFDEGVYLTDNGVAHLKSIRPKTIANVSRKAKPKNPNSLKRMNSNGLHDEERSDEDKGQLTNEQQTKKTTIKKYTGKSSRRATRQWYMFERRRLRAGSNLTTPVVVWRPANMCSRLGVGGFIVKIRGNRRRQELLHMDSEILRSKNKRLRKTILEEHMPPEMQEAFFGMELANQNPTRSALNDNFIFNDQSVAPLKCSNDEYSIQLDADTLKYLTTKRKPLMPVPQEDESDMRKTV